MPTAGFGPLLRVSFPRTRVSKTPSFSPAPAGLGGCGERNTAIFSTRPLAWQLLPSFWTWVTEC